MGRCIPCEKLQQLYKPYTAGGNSVEYVVRKGNDRIVVNRLDETGRVIYEVSAIDIITLAINSFTVAPAMSLKGTTQATFNFNWAYNKNVTSQSIASPGITIPSLSVSDRTLELTGQSITEDTAFTLSASDGITNPTKVANALFGNHIYVGKGIAYDANTPEATLVSFIQGLADKRLQVNRFGVLTSSTVEDEYDYYAVPVAFGEPLFKSRTAVTFGGFFLIATYDIENSAGFVESYNIYRSVYDSLNGQIFDIT